MSVFYILIQLVGIEVEAVSETWVLELMIVTPSMTPRPEILLSTIKIIISGMALLLLLLFSSETWLLVYVCVCESLCMFTTQKRTKCLILAKD